MLSPGKSLIVEEYIGLAISTARRFSKGRDADELRSECLLALSRAVLSYVPGSACSLRTYIITACRRACLNVIRPRAISTESLDGVDVVERLDTRHETLASRLERLSRVTLDRMERETLDDWRYGYTIRQAAARRGVSKSLIVNRREAVAARVRSCVEVN